MDIDAYLARIGLSERPEPDLAGLAALQHAHRRSIAFENLDVLLGRGINLAPAAVFAKLVDQRRGGYCFEHNTLFLAALTALGFSARPLLARVWLGADGVPPRTHTFSLVAIEGPAFIADAGFGGSDVPPMQLHSGSETQMGDVHFALTQVSGSGWMLTRNGQQQYSFTEDTVFPADLEMANHWVSTAPGSRFVRNSIVSIIREDGLLSLTNGQFSSGDDSSQVSSAADYRETLRKQFGIALTAAEAAVVFGE